MVEIMVALWFHELTNLDRVAVKPHASPVLHAINYLLGDLDAKYLTTLRAKGGLQSYPSRIKDPDTVDFSTGSVGIGATAPLWAAFAHRYIRSQFARRTARRAIHQPARRRRAGRGRHLGGRRRPVGRPAGRAAVGGRPEPAVPGPGGAGHPDRTPAGHVRLGRLAGDHPQVGPADQRTVRPRRAAASCAAGSSRCPTRSTSGCCGPTRRTWRRRLVGDTGSRAAAGAGAEPSGRRPCRRGPRSRRPRPRAADRHLPRRRHPPPHRRFRLHHQGPRAADRGPPEQPLRPAHRGPDAGPRRSAPASSCDDPWQPFPPGSAEHDLCATPARSSCGGCPPPPDPAGHDPRCAGATPTASRSPPRPRSAGCWPT